jgi:phosphoribosylformimino-5-aminoimidazole carboxamide ribotide isomerase
MRIIPVIDIKDGKAVHARGGDRSSYRGVRSRLYDGNDPIGLASAYRGTLGLSTIYVADLDAIEDGQLNHSILGGLSREGLDAWVDIGLRDASRLAELRAYRSFRWILATETLLGPASLSETTATIDPDAIVFGLDLEQGRPLLCSLSAWNSPHAIDLVESALGAGIRRVLLLDLARVGSGKGVGTLSLVATLLRRFGPLEITVGGGVASLDDLQAAADSGASGVLVGSALHDGRISASDLRNYRD